MPKTERNILTDSEKVEFLNLIEGKGEKPPKEWQLVHSELCNPNEEELELDSIIDNLSAEGVKFAIDLVSNPNENSFLDSGIVKVRYRYVLDPIHAGEEKIKDNTREFCEELIRKDLIYRREDINAMSFRGSNPIAKKRYSIFNSAGGWNCRHAWQREIYVMPQRTKKVENGLKTSTETVQKINLSMPQETKSLKVKFGEFLSEVGRKLTEQEVVELTSVMLEDEQKFVEVQVEDKILRIDAEKPEVGASVSWVNEEGEMMEVENGSIPVSIGEENMILVIEDRKIAEIQSVEEAESTEEAEQEMSSEENASEESTSEDSVESQISKLKEEIPAMIQSALEAKLSENNDKQTKAFSAIVEAKLSKLPAFPSDEVNAELSADEDDSSERGSNMLERIVLGKK